MNRNRVGRRLIQALAVAVVALAGLALWGEPAQQRQPEVPTRREFTVVARQYSFTPSRLEVNAGELVRITVVAEDMPYSLAIDAYRVLKRLSPGHPVTIEFLALQPGTFPFYCSLEVEGCRTMRGELIVR